MRRTTLLLVIVWCCFVVRVLFEASMLPLWEGFDEYSHFALIQYVALHHGAFPLRQNFPAGSRQIDESRKLTPAPWLIHDSTAGLRSYEEFFSLPPDERRTLRARLEAMPQEWQHVFTGGPIYEAQQPPLYYWIASLFYPVTVSWSLPQAVWFFRILTALMASLVVPLSFFASRRVMPFEELALGTAIVIACFPQLAILVSHVGNEGLSVAIGALFVLIFLRVIDEPRSWLSGVWLAIVTAAALLTKAYFLAVVPIAFIALIRRRGGLSQAAAFAATVVALAGWWYARNVAFTGTLTGESGDVRAVATSAMSLMQAVRQVHWPSVFDQIALTHIWLANWSFLVLRSWMYRVMELMLLAALAGVILRKPRRTVLLATLCGALILGLCFQAAQVFRIRGVSTGLGYFLYGLVVAETVVLITGIAALLPSRRELVAIPIIASVLLALDQFGVWFVLLPYYSGFTRHTASGGLPAGRLAQYWNGGFGEMSRNLASTGVVNASTITVLAVLYLICTAVLLVVALRAGVSRPQFVTTNLAVAAHKRRVASA